MTRRPRPPPRAGSGCPCRRAEGSPPPAPPPASGLLDVLLLRGRRDAGPLPSGGATVVPGPDLRLDVAGRGHHRRAAGELPTGLDDPAVEVLDGPPDVGLGCLPVQGGVQLGVLAAQADRRRGGARGLFPPHELLYPPVGGVLFRALPP